MPKFSYIKSGISQMIHPQVIILPQMIDRGAIVQSYEITDAEAQLSIRELQDKYPCTVPYQNKRDVAAAKEALAEYEADPSKAVTLEELKTELGADDIK